MSLFERLGRKVEQFKQEVDETRDAEPKYQCRNCETVYYSAYDSCPECDSESVGHIDADDE